MTNKYKKYGITQSPLYKLSSKTKLAELLNADLALLKDIVENNHKYYNVWEIKKKDKKNRPVQSPKPKLKVIQRRIYRLLARVETPEWLMSGKKGISYVDNAKFHKENNYFLCTDINSFYPSCSKEYVFKFFKNEFKMPEDTAWFISDLVTFNNIVPTGAPTSQIIAYWAYGITFKKIQKSASKYGIKMSLYVDDITFSSDKPIPKRFIELVSKRLSEVKLQIKEEKTQTYYPNQYKTITGCCITPGNELKVTNKLRFKIVSLLKDKTIEKLTSEETNRAFGLLNAARQTEPDFYDSSYKRVKKRYIEGNYGV
jgi:hypothetical protein